MTNINYSPDQEEFWDFSWDEMALIDLPTQIEYVIAQTNVPSLGYIGHSEGTIQAFAGFSANHTLADRVNIFVALAPVQSFPHHLIMLRFFFFLRLHMLEMRFLPSFERWPSQPIRSSSICSARPSSTFPPPSIASFLATVSSCLTSATSCSRQSQARVMILTRRGWITTCTLSRIPLA